MKTGSEIFIDFLRHRDIDLVFGYPGGAILPIYDAVFRSGIRHILVRHEQGAIHAAEGYAKATGKIGVVIVTSGPGATNLVTGLADAKMDSVPIMAITGQVPTHLIGTDAFQEADIYGISIPITKYNYLVKDVDELASTLEESYVIALSGRPGPVLIDIPKDVQNAKTSNTSFVVSEHIKKRFQSEIPIEGNIEALAQAINQAERPLFYVGGGAIHSGAHVALRKVAEKAHIPVVMTLMGLGSFPQDHPLSFGMLGMHGSKYANYSVSSCDLLVCLGARFDDRVTGKLDAFAKQCKIAQVDVDPAEIGKLVQIDYPIRGNLKRVLELILDLVEYNEREKWFEQLYEWKEKFPYKYYKDEKVIKPQHFLEVLDKKTQGRAILTTEVGQHQMWSAQYYGFLEPRTFLSSGGLGTMGFGFPAAIGAKLGCPERIVVSIAGDGSFQMNVQELATVSMYQIDVKIVVINNGFLGMVRQWQEMFFGSNFSHSDFTYNPDFVLLGRSYGIDSMRITQENEVEKGMDFLLQKGKACLLEVVVPENENVFPMIPAGAAIHEMIDIDD